MTGVPWSIADDELLRKLARSGASLAEIAIQMKRGKSSIRSRAFKMKVTIARERNGMTPLKISAGSQPSDRLRFARAFASAGARLKAKK